MNIRWNFYIKELRSKAK